MRVRILILGILVLFLFTNTESQNLVPNPSFEIFKKCPKEYSIASKKELIPDWLMPTRGTADYFNSCTLLQVGVPQNFMGYCYAKDGKAYAGIILFQDFAGDVQMKANFNYREYLQAKLIEPLQINQLYFVKFFYSIASYSTYSINRFGAYLSKQKISKRHSTGLLKCKPQIFIDSSKIVTERDNWFAVCDTFRAKGGERYITIGNFYDDAFTQKQNEDVSIYSNFLQNRILLNRIAYYYIDLVSVTKFDVQSDMKREK